MIAGMSHGVFFGDNVRTAREAQEWTRADLLRRLEAAGTPMHATTLKRIEDGEQVAKLPEALAISEVLQTSVEVLGDFRGSSLHSHIDDLTQEVLHKRSAVIYAWTEWVTASRTLLKASQRYALIADDLHLEVLWANYHEVSGREEIFSDMARAEYGELADEDAVDSYEDAYEKGKNEQG